MLKIILKRVLMLLVLAVLPVLFLSMSLNFQKINGDFHLKGVDPEYCYLANSLALSSGKTNLYIDHPGTPLIVMMSITNSVTNFFRQGKLIEDVVQNPEIYLKNDNTVMISLLAIALLFSGFIIYKSTGDLFTALFFQFIPFISEIVIIITERIMPEPLFIATSALLISYILADLNNKIPNYKIIKNRALFYGVISGLAIAIKFTSISILIIPFLIIKEKKNKMLYIVYTISAFLIFAFPILFKLDTFFKWMTGMFIHSGIHGSGNSNIVDLNVFLPNIKLLFLQTKFFFFPFFISIGMLILLLFRKMRNKINDKKLINLLLGLIFAGSIHIFLVAKHYALYYMIPILVFTLLYYYVNIQIIKKIFSVKPKIFDYFLYVIIVVLLAFSNQGISKLKNFNQNRITRFEERTPILEFISSNNIEQPLIISSDLWNIKKEFGLWFGRVMTPYSDFLAPQLQKYYPHTYFNVSEFKVFIDWENKSYDINSILEKYKSVNIILFNYNSKSCDNFINQLKTINNLDVKLLFLQRVDLDLYILQVKWI